jgi:hypothetical protein
VYLDKCYSRQYIATEKLSFTVTPEHGSFSTLHPPLNLVTAVVLRSGIKDIIAYPRAVNGRRIIKENNIFLFIICWKI